MGGGPLPLFPQVGGVQDGGRDPGPVDGRVGIHGANQDLQLRLHLLGLISIFADHSEGSHALTWEGKMARLLFCLPRYSKPRLNLLHVSCLHQKHHKNNSWL